MLIPWVSRRLESHSQPLSNEELYELTEQQKEDEDEDNRGNKEMQKKDLTDILSTIDMAAEKLCDNDPEWKHSCTVKWGIKAILQSYYETLQEKKKKAKIDVKFFLDVL
jgi:hypothetical protein